MSKRVFIIILFFINSSLLYAYDEHTSVNKLQFPKAEYLSENTIRIPFKLVDHLIVIEAEVLKRKGNFIIDTGSEKLILNNIHFKDTHSIPSYEEHSGVTNSVDLVSKKFLKNLFIRDFTVDNIKSDLIDLSHIEKSKKIQLLGVVGYNVLKDYEIFIDFYLKQITLSKVDKYGKRLDKRPYLEKIIDSLNFSLTKHTIVLNAYIKQQKFKFGLDTGAEVNLLDKRSFKKVANNFLSSKEIYMIGAGKRKTKVLAGKLSRVKLSESIYCGLMKTIVTNLNPMKSAYGTSLNGVLGYEFIAMRRIIINYKKEKLYFVKLPFTN